MTAEKTAEKTVEKTIGSIAATTDSVNREIVSALPTAKIPKHPKSPRAAKTSQKKSARPSFNTCYAANDVYKAVFFA